MKAAFDVFDAEKKGTIDVNDLIELLESHLGLDSKRPSIKSALGKRCRES